MNTALLTIVAIGIGVLIVMAGVRYVERLHKFSGYREIAWQVRKIARAMHKATILRESGDLVLQGNYKSRLVLVRFARQEDLLGVTIQMELRVDFSLFLASRKNISTRGRVLLRVNESFDATWMARTDHPKEAGFFLFEESVVEQCQKLCRSASAVLQLESGTLEFSDAIVPENCSVYVQERLGALAQLAAAAEDMHAARSRKAAPRGRRIRLLVRALAGIAVAIPVVWLIGEQFPNSAAESPSASVAAVAGIPAIASAKIRDLERWRLATSNDFDPAAVAWLNAQGLEAHGEIVGHFGAYVARESAYVLVSNNASAGGSKRIVVFVNGQVRFDTELPEIAVAAKVPRDNLARIEWQGKPPLGEADGDGVLIVTRPDQANTALVVYASGVQMLSGTPTDYHSVSLH